MHVEEIHQRAAAKASAAVPNFKIGTPEHDQWLAIYDREVTRLNINPYPREEYWEDEYYRWHPDNPCLTLEHKNVWS